ncbi:unnamed protein product [Arctia plantaginis]|uniref:Endonuclease/exonuclease/phosphatase domain-containing protein n=1 Tax=Arctia plantaginis TaxID=874455 RepID=A0A8S0ZUM7_ARCPL|nr:unnamed protein product [Arctia plantaginis]
MRDQKRKHDQEYTYYSKKNLNQNDGLVVYVRKEINVKASEPDISEGNCLLLDIGGYSVVCSYRPPCYSNPRKYIESLDNLFKKIKNKNIVFRGDININTLPCNVIVNDSVNDYLCLMASHGLQQAITLPTRTNSCLDHFMIRTNAIWQTSVFPELTDHSHGTLVCQKFIDPAQSILWIISALLRNSGK